MDFTQEMQADMLTMSNNFKYQMVNADTDEAEWHKIEDLKNYVVGQLASDRAKLVGKVKVSVGTDSKFHPRGRKAWSVSYVTIIAFTFGNRGTHLIARRDRRSGDGRLSLFDRLWTEVTMTVNLALWVRENIGIEPEVHLDINPKKDTGSNVVYQSAKGYGESFGFVVDVKPNSPAASVAADHFVRNKY